jgi:sugar O-acyltransferase (sialic acid O-acetyltransferase NeuD family)
LFVADVDPTSSWLLYAGRTAYAAEVAEIIWRRDESVAAVVDNVEAGEPFESRIAQVVSPGDLGDALVALPVAIPLLTPGYRFAVEAEARRKGCTSFPVLLDPTAVIASTAACGEGSVVNAAAVIGANADVGRFVHVNRTASIAHDCAIGVYTSVGPGAVLAGSVVVERGAFLGAGVVCAPEVTIGANAIVGAGAVVVRDVPAGAVAVGNPARVTREGVAGYRDVGVSSTP